MPVPSVVILRLFKSTNTSEIRFLLDGENLIKSEGEQFFGLISNALSQFVNEKKEEVKEEEEFKEEEEIDGFVAVGGGTKDHDADLKFAQQL